jgi:hypothetical protein
LSNPDLGPCFHLEGVAAGTNVERVNSVRCSGSGSTEAQAPTIAARRRPPPVRRAHERCRDRPGRGHHADRACPAAPRPTSIFIDEIRRQRLAAALVAVPLEDGQLGESIRQRTIAFRAVGPTIRHRLLGSGFEAHPRRTAIREFYSGLLQNASERGDSGAVSCQDAWSDFESLNGG